MGAPSKKSPKESLFKVIQPAFSLGVWSLSFAWMTGVAAGVVGMLPFVPFAWINQKWAAPGFGQVVKFTGANVRIIWDPEFDAQMPSMFVQNHVSVMDGHVSSYVIPQPFCGLMKAEHFKIPAYGWVMKHTQGIPVYPRSSGRTAEITEHARNRIDNGLSILTFPEGHRTTSGKMREFKRGVFFMARDAGIPVVPIAVRGLYEVNHKGKWMFDPGPIRIYVGKQVQTAGLNDEEVKSLATRMHDVVERFVEHGELPESARHLRHMVE